MDVNELIKNSLEAWNKKDKEAFLANMTESSEIISPGGLVLRGREGAETFWNVWQGAFPDSRGTVSNVFVAGDQACDEGTFEGTHTGTLYGTDGNQIPPTGKRVSLSIAQVRTIRDGKFVTDRIYFDQVELLTQLGLMPTTAA